MKRIRQHSLITSILVSELLYLNSKTVKKSIYQSQNLKLTNKNSLTLLNLFSFLQNIKQIIRLIQFQEKKLNNNMQIILSNIFLRQILAHILKKYKLSNDSKILINNTLNYNVKTNTAIYLDSNSVKLKTLQKAFNNKINTILYIGTQLNKNIFGNYKLHTEINTFKKLIFLSLILLLSQQ